ncbi:oligosaccharide flippase family protein [Limosilactobacillus vaginalis]|uniref:oligosaccharide flippase family protein n=1 Tax=Limosilactobacillus vaginalis TaxID=1633 RepID=UPI0025A4244D|nr:oligosaccharide flippase family protein [Limosilactobacillus vaginalis]MDM8244394.1 oligosaccharide flippase family protein [Limosilactobacillus vaginalis]
MRVIKNYLYNVGYQLLAIILPLITSPYISRVLLPKGVGIFTYTYSVSQYFVLIAGLGISLYGSRQIAYVKNNSEKISKTFFEIIIVEILAVVLTLMLYVVFILIYRRYSIYFFSQSFYIISVLFDISWFYMGLEDFQKIVLKNSLVKLSTAVCIFVFVRNYTDLNKYILILSLGTLLGNLTFWPYLRHMIVRIKFSHLTPIKHLKPALFLFVPQIAIQFYTQLDKIILGAMGKEDAAGFYNYSDGIIRMALTLVTSVGTVMLPHVATAYSKGENDKVKEMVKKSFKFVSFLSIGIAFGIASISIEFGPFFYGNDYEPVGKVMLLEAPAIVPIAWASVIGNQYLIPTKQTNTYVMSVLYGAFINLILCIPLILKLGLYGAMLITVVSEGVVTGYQMIKVRKQLQICDMLKETYRFFLVGFIMFLVIFTLMIHKKLSILLLTIIVFCGASFYILVLIVFDEDLRSLKKEKLL